MAHWYYLGRTTTSVNHPEKGPMVLIPRSRFEAPQASVHHLLQAKLVKRLPDPPAPKLSAASVQTSALVVKAPEMKEPPQAATKSIEAIEVVAEDAIQSYVVASGESDESEGDSELLAETAEEGESPSEEKGTSESKSGRRRRRRGN